MFRTLSTAVFGAATLALASTAPASAQSVRELSGDMWSCRLTSLVGDPSGDMSITFGRAGALDAEFYFEVPTDAGAVSMHFAVTGSWSLNAPAISMAVTDTELIGGWIDGEEVDEETKGRMEASLAGQMNSFAGESRVAYIAKHALVLEEDETSMSCWR